MDHTSPEYQYRLGLPDKPEVRGYDAFSDGAQEFLRQGLAWRLPAL